MHVVGLLNIMPSHSIDLPKSFREMTRSVPLSRIIRIKYKPSSVAIIGRAQHSLLDQSYSSIKCLRCNGYGHAMCGDSVNINIEFSANDEIMRQTYSNVRKTRLEKCG